MVFKSDKQRKFVMAKLNSGVRSNITPQVVRPSAEERMKSSKMVMEEKKEKEIRKNIPDFVKNDILTEQQLNLLKRRLNNKKIRQ